MNPVRRRGGKAGFRLADIRARNFTDLKPVACGVQLLLQDLFIALLQIHDRDVAQHVDIGGYGVEQQLLFLRDQIGARTVDRAFGGLDFGISLQPQQRLRQFQPQITRMGHAAAAVQRSLE